MTDFQWITYLILCAHQISDKHICVTCFSSEKLVEGHSPTRFLLTNHINGHLYETTKYQYLHTEVKVAFQTCIYHCPWLDWFSYHWMGFIVIGRLIVNHTAMWRHLTKKDRTWKLPLLSLAETQGSLVFSFNMLSLIYWRLLLQCLCVSNYKVQKFLRLIRIIRKVTSRYSSKLSITEWRTSCDIKKNDKQNRLH